LARALKENEKYIEENKKLQQELEEQKELLRKSQEENEKQLTQNSKLGEELSKEKNKTQELEGKLHFAVKDLPSLPRKENKLKVLGKSIKTKVHHFLEKTKHQSQELFA
jgi:predicted nuclease with TOPRIM domain